MKLYGEYFTGNKASPYGIQNGYLDYATLAKAFDAVLNNDRMETTKSIGRWTQESGPADAEVMQWYIVSGEGADILADIGEVLWYNAKLNIYLWGVTHYGTAWDYVLTDVKLNQGDEAWTINDTGNSADESV